MQLPLIQFSGFTTGKQNTECEIGRLHEADDLFCSQIERLFAIWQAVNDKESESWFSDAHTAEEPLLPFLKPKDDGPGKYWTSNLSKQCETFGYTYPDLGGKGKDVGTRFRNLYEWSVPITNSRKSGTVPKEMKPLNLSEAEVFPTQEGASDATPIALLSLQTPQELPPVLEKRTAELVQSRIAPERRPDSGKSWEWYIDDEVQRYVKAPIPPQYFYLTKAQQPCIRWGIHYFQLHRTGPRRWP